MCFLTWGSHVWYFYLRHARVGRIHKVAEQRLSVIGADGGGGVREKVVVKHALSKKLVEESGRVDRTQGTSEPGVLDGNIHSDWRKSSLNTAWRGSGWQVPAQLRVQQVERKVRWDRENRMMQSSEWIMFPECLSSAAQLPPLYIPESQKERL